MDGEELAELSRQQLYRLWLYSVLEDHRITTVTVPTDLQSGIILCKCIKKLVCVDLKPEIKDPDNIQAWQRNVCLVLDYLKSLRVDPKVTFEYIVQGDRNSLFTLLDSIILHLDVHSPGRASYQRTTSLGKKLLFQWFCNQAEVENKVFLGSLVECFWDGLVLYKLAVKFCGCQQQYAFSSTEGQCSQIIAVAMGRFEEILNVPRGFFNPVDLAQRRLDDYIMLVYLAVLRRKIVGNNNDLMKFDGPPMKSPKSPELNLSPLRKAQSERDFQHLNGHVNSHADGMSSEGSSPFLQSTPNSALFSRGELTPEQQQQQQESLKSLFEKLKRSSSPEKIKPRSASTDCLIARGKASYEGDPLNVVSENSLITQRAVSMDSASGETSEALWDPIHKRKGSFPGDSFISPSKTSLPQLGLNSKSNVTFESKEEQSFSELMTFAVEKGYTSSSSNSPSKVLSPEQPLKSSETPEVKKIVADGTVDTAALPHDDPLTDASLLSEDSNNCACALSSPPLLAETHVVPTDFSVQNLNELALSEAHQEGLALDTTLDLRNDGREVAERDNMSDETQFSSFRTTDKNSKEDCTPRVHGPTSFFDPPALCDAEEYEDALLVYLDYMHVVALQNAWKQDVMVAEGLRKVQDNLRHQTSASLCPPEVFAEMKKIQGNAVMLDSGQSFPSADAGERRQPDGQQHDNSTSLAQRIRELEFENSVMKRRLESYEKRQILTTNRIELKDDENDKLQHKLTKANEKISSLMNEIQRGKVNRHRGNEDLTSIERSLEEDIGSRKAELDLLNREIKERRQSVVRHERELSSELSNLKVKLNEAEKNNFTLETELEASQTVIKHLEGRLENCSSTLSNTKHENNLTLHEVSIVRAENEILKQKLEVLEARNLETQGFTDSMSIASSEHSQALLDELRNLEGSLNDLQREKEVIESRYLLKKRECQELEKQLKNLRSSSKTTLTPEMPSRLNFNRPSSSNRRTNLTPEKRNSTRRELGTSDDLPGVVVVTRTEKKTGRQNYSTEDTRIFLKTMEEKLQQSQSTIKTALRGTYRT